MSSLRTTVAIAAAAILPSLGAASIADAFTGAPPLASSSAASASLTCSKWISGQYAYGTCTGSGTWRVVALCNWELKKVGPWVSGSRSTNAGPCSDRATGAVIEFQ